MFHNDDELEALAGDDLPNFRLQESSGFVVDDGADVDSDDDGDAVDAPSYIVPDQIQKFVLYFHKHFRDQNVYELHAIYENHFHQLTERYFKASSWPPAESIAKYVDNDGLFLMLYKNLYFRHISAKLTPTLSQRSEAWQNYVDLFEALLNAESHLDVDLDLPVQWLWDIIDDFVTQLQDFCYYKQTLAGRSADDSLWNVKKAIECLEGLVKKSQIKKILEAQKKGKDEDDETSLLDNSFGAHPVYRMLGYFSLVGLIQLQCSLSDYHRALTTADVIDLTKKGLYARVTACQVSLFYNLSFAYLMARRHVECVKSVSTILTFIARTKQYHTRSSQYDKLLAAAERLYALLALCTALYVVNVDDALMKGVRDRHGDAIRQLTQGDTAAFETLFLLASPRFIRGSPPPRVSGAGSIASHAKAARRAAAQRAAKLYVRDAQHASLLPTLRSFLKLYTSISITKLASFLDVDAATCRTYLLAYKQQARSLVGPDKWASASDVNFYIDGDMVHIADAKPQRRHAQYFLRHIHKFDELTNNLARVQR